MTTFAAMNREIAMQRLGWLRRSVAALQAQIREICDSLGLPHDCEGESSIGGAHRNAGDGDTRHDHSGRF